MTRTALTRTALTRTALTGAALALALLASAPAMAGCRSVLATDVYGDDGYYDAWARDGAYLGVYARGDRHEVTGTVAGCGTSVVTGSLGRGTRTHLDVRGLDNQVGTEVRSGGRIGLTARGDDNEIALRAANGGVISGRVYGSGNYVRGSAW